MERAVIDESVRAAEQCEAERCCRRRDAAAAIVDDLVAIERAGFAEQLLDLGERHEAVADRVDQRQAGHVDAAFDVTLPAVRRWRSAGMETRRQGIDGAGYAVANGFEHILLVGDQRPRRPHCEVAPWVTAAWAVFDRPVFIGPSLPAAVEYGGIVEAEQAKQPPDPRRPPDATGAVDDHARLIADAETFDCARKILRARCGEIQMAVVIGEV